MSAHKGNFATFLSFFLSIWKDENLTCGLYRAFLRRRKAPPPLSAVQFNSCKHRTSMSDPRKCLCNQRIILAEFNVDFLHAVWKSPDLSVVGQMHGRERANNQSVKVASGLCLILYSGVLGFLEHNLNECITGTKKHVAKKSPKLCSKIQFIWCKCTQV